LVVIFIIVDDSIKSFILLIAIIVGSLAIIIEMGLLYYSGVDLERSNKIYPEEADIGKQPN